MYHGIHGDRQARGPSDRSRSYSVSLPEFVEQMHAIARRTGVGPSVFPDLWPHGSRRPSWAVTFDDGLENILPALELLDERQWLAHCFIVGEWIGRPGYLSPRDIVGLRARGHVVGSYSHPDPMSRLPYPRIVEEWRRGIDSLGEVLGEDVRVASLPGGSYSREVATAAAEAGITVLFTSEPVSRVRTVQGCAVVGRYVVRDSTHARAAASLAAGSRFACARQRAQWDARKLAKKTLGDAYYTMRARFVR
jgi:peptidoglycan/xylan/chitin deacetylase (PgdA/CDA1 family)